jgi:hypothetical protein
MGGGLSISGRRNEAIRSSSSSNAGYASASFRERLAIDATVGSRSLWKKIARPSGSIAAYAGSSGCGS